MRINRAVIIVIFINGIVTPRREPIARIPIVIPASDKNDGREMLLPPNTIVPLAPISSECVRITEVNVGRRALDRWLLFARRVDASRFRFRLRRRRFVGVLTFGRVSEWN